MTNCATANDEPANERDWPRLAQAAAAVDDVDDHERHEQGKERKLAPDHRAQVALA